MLAQIENIIKNIWEADLTRRTQFGEEKTYERTKVMINYNRRVTGKRFFNEASTNPVHHIVYIYMVQTTQQINKPVKYAKHVKYAKGMWVANPTRL